MTKHYTIVDFLKSVDKRKSITESCTSSESIDKKKSIIKEQTPKYVCCGHSVYTIGDSNYTNDSPATLLSVYGIFTKRVKSYKMIVDNCFWKLDEALQKFCILHEESHVVNYKIDDESFHDQYALLRLSKEELEIVNKEFYYPVLQNMKTSNSVSRKFFTEDRIISGINTIATLLTNCVNI